MKKKVEKKENISRECSCVKSHLFSAQQTAATFVSVSVAQRFWNVLVKESYP